MLKACHTPCPDICPVSPDLPFRPTISSLLAESPKRFDPGATEGQESVTLVAVNYGPLRPAAHNVAVDDHRPCLSAPNEKSTPRPWRSGPGVERVKQRVRTR